MERKFSCLRLRLAEAIADYQAQGSRGDLPHAKLKISSQGSAKFSGVSLAYAGILANTMKGELLGDFDPLIDTNHGLLRRVK